MKAFEEHLQTLTENFRVLRSYNMTLSASKCHLFQKEVHFLGHVISKEGIRMDLKRVTAINDMPLPQSKKQLVSAMCQMRYYRSYILNYTNIELPLRDKCKTDVPWLRDETTQQAIYTDKELHAFNTLRNKLTQQPILSHPDWSKPFTIHTDACKTGLGATFN